MRRVDAQATAVSPSEAESTQSFDAFYIVRFGRCVGSDSFRGHWGEIVEWPL
jgi:hypothetical protein